MTALGYLLGQAEKVSLLKDPDILRHFNNVNNFSKGGKSHIIYMPEAMIYSEKRKTITQHR